MSDRPMMPAPRRSAVATGFAYAKSVLLAPWRAFLRIDRAKRIPSALSLPLGAAGVVAIWVGLGAAAMYADILAENAELAAPFREGGMPVLVAVLKWACLLLGAAFVAASAFGYRRRPRALWVLRKAYVGVYCLAGFFAVVGIMGVNIIADKRLALGGIVPEAVDLFYIKWDFVWPAGLMAIVIALVHRASRRPAVAAVYTGQVVVEAKATDVAIAGAAKDPIYRSSMKTSIALHVFVLLVLPWLLKSVSCVPGYLIPGGGGGGGGQSEPAMAKIIVKKQTTNRKRTKYTLRLNSPVLFHMPTVDDSEVSTQVQVITENTYVAKGLNTGLGSGSGGGMGTGKGTGGFAGGVAGGRIQFIRIQYDGEGWDDGMDPVSNADGNFLREFRKASNMPVAARGEAETIRKLTGRPKGQQAPFVFMTGRKQINIPSSDLALLRKYLLQGGMVIADCSGRQWDQSFRNMVRTLFPDKPFVDIADDDEIFRMERMYQFPNGAPPFWHHGGMRAMGIKHMGRWVIFYHPGDMHDAWKTGHSGLDPQLANLAYQLGIDLVYYAIIKHMAVTGKAP
jgi:hypothetical protein